MTPASALPDTGGYSVVVDSVGDATAYHLSALTRVLGRSPELIARHVLCAPAPLIGRLDEGTADGVCRELRRAGLEARVCAAGAVPARDPRRFDLALRVTSAEAIDPVLRALMAFLGVGAEPARDLLIRDPAVFLGGVTEATVRALRRRLAGPEVVVDASDASRATYDVFAVDEDATARRRLDAALREAEVPPAGAGPIAASGLDVAQAARTAAAIERCRGGARLINRDFYWFDVQLTSARDGDALRDILERRVGVPGHAVGRLLARLPVVLLAQARWPEAEALIAALAEAGARAEATLLSTRRFGLRLGRVGDGHATDRILGWLGRLPAGERQRLVRGDSTEAPGPFTLLQARWLRRDLASVGTEAELVSR